MMDPARQEQLRERAARALAEGKITQAEYDYFLKHELGISEPSKTKSVMEDVLAVLLLIGLISGVWMAFDSDGLTGLVALDIPSTETILLNQTNITSLRISGTLAGGSAKVYLLPQRLLVFEADARYAILTDKERYALGEPVNVTILPLGANHTLWLTTEAGERTSISAIDTSIPGAYTLDALINDSGTIIKVSTAFTVKNDTTIDESAPRAAGPVMFADACEQTCSLLPLDEEMTLEIQTSGDAQFTITDIDVMQHSNAPPMLRAAMPDITLDLGESTTLDLGMYFSDPDGDMLLYEYQSASIPLRIENGTLTIEGASAGATQSVIYASDLQELVQSNTFTITVVGAQNATAQNSTNETDSAPPDNATIQNGTIANTTQNTTSDLNMTLNSTTIPANVTINESNNLTNSSLDCTDSDPNRRPIECIQRDVNYFVDQELLLENVDRVAVGKFTPIGNLLIRGDLIERSTASPAAGDFTIGYVDGLGEYHATIWIDSATGDLHLRGTLTEANTNIVLNEGWFGMTNRRGILLAMADKQTGDLVLRGSILPYRRTLGEGR